MKLILNKQLIILNLFLNFYELFCIKLNKIKLRDPASLFKRNSFNENKINQPKYKWTEEWLDNIPIDHFSFKDNRTFKLRYLINTDYFKEKNAPIFFYTGNEGNIEGFAENTGFMFDIAPKFGAALIFAEHRYYGKTLPFGNNSYTNISNLGYLSSEQALADFAILIKYLKEKRLSNSNKSPVISFGGSYGGMLTAWMRIKYPHLIDGGIASSAPVHYFSNSTPQYSYFDITTRTFINSGCSLNLLLNSFNSIRKMANTENGRKFLNKNYHLSPSSQINNSSDGEQLINYFLGIMDILATVDYPYPNNFLAPLPGWPVKVACKPFLSAKTSEELAIALFDGLNMFYNFNNSNTLCLWGDDCVYPPSPLGDNGDGWDWQACTEMVMLMCARGPPFDPYNKSCPTSDQERLDSCLDDSFGYNKELFRPNWVITNYGLEFPTATNLIFSNGWLDPWSGGGWRQTTTNVGSIYSYIIEDGAHHYDLRGENPSDTNSVKEVRQKEIMHITEWIRQAKINNSNNITKY